MNFQFRNSALSLTLALMFGSLSIAQEANWDNWRGPNFNGAVTSGKPPINWSSDSHIKWKITVPGAGSSTPIIHGNQVIVLSAIKTDRIKEGASDQAAPSAENSQGDRPKGRRGGGGRRSPAPTNFHEFVVLSYDRATGKELWKTVVVENVPHEAGHNTNTFASSSPVTDGKMIYASFGSRGIYCLDMKGKVQWSKQLGTMRTAAGFGEGASAALASDKLIVPWDHEGESFIVAIKTSDGSEVWRTPRSEGTCWSTPLIVQHKGRTQVIANGRTVRSYDAANGKLIWECGGQTSNPIPTPILFGENVICMTGYRGNSILSIPLDSQGDVTGKASWSRSDSAPYVPTATLYEGKLYLCKGNSGVISCVDAKTGDAVITDERLEGVQMMYSSPVAANGHVYYTSRDGKTVVLKSGAPLQVVATNQLDDTVDSSLAIVGNSLFVRGLAQLYCIE